MSRKITPEERQILLDNPELVMFDPYSAFRTHRLSLGKALMLPVAAAALAFLWGYFFPEFINAHPHLFVGIACVGLVAACGCLPVIYLTADDRDFKRAKEEHYARQLRMLLPEDPECVIAAVQWTIPQKGEGVWILDGKEEMFGFASYVNYFMMEPESDLAVITDRGKFWAFVRRDAKTESFYH